jgi:antitoxin (DNA-binding transcriptional repressor) of toxin-antitoxin stability system
MKTNHIVLPISALKSETATLFDALAQGRTVYVSKHGAVIAAFRPFDDIPEAVAAAYVMPGADTAELTARDMAQAVPSRAVADAAAGLPSLVTKNHEIYGILTEASIPVPPSVPSLDVAAARSEAVRSFLADNPAATVADIAAYRKTIEEKNAEVERRRPAEEEEVIYLTVDAVNNSLDWWTKRGSKVEGVVNGLFDSLIESRRRSYQPGVVCATAVQNTLAAWQANYAEMNTDTSGAAAALREGVRLAGSDPVLARERYVYVLAAAPGLHAGALWKLGDLARGLGQPGEARAWYELALRWNPDGDAVSDLAAPDGALRTSRRSG